MSFAVGLIVGLVVVAVMVLRRLGSGPRRSMRP